MIYGIGDLHFDYSKEKPMDIFGENWIKHEEKIIDNWTNKINHNDLVLIPGDISWALKLEEAYFDLEVIDKLPGKKVLSKGNHDFWWDSLKKMNELGFDSIFFLQNNHYIYNDTVIFGARGWSPRDSEGFDEKDEKIFNRELIRLELSLNSIKGIQVDKKIVMLHYPPFNMNSSPNEFVELMKKHNIDLCIYGHLHDEGHRFVIEGNIEGIEFHCVSSDFVDFNPKIILGG